MPSCHTVCPGSRSGLGPFLPSAASSPVSSTRRVFDTEAEFGDVFIPKYAVVLAEAAGLSEEFLGLV